MDRIKIEAFLSTPPCSNSMSLNGLLKEIEEEFGERVEIIVYQENNKLFNQYHLTALPAVVIGEMIKIMGFCPSKESIISGLKELGME